MKIPKTIPYMFGEQLPNGTFATRIIEIDKTHPKWDVALKEFIRWEGKDKGEVPVSRKVKKS